MEGGGLEVTTTSCASCGGSHGVNASVHVKHFNRHSESTVAFTLTGPAILALTGYADASC
eukprot:1152921-Pelagomonas_calceolata.AAC.1